MRILIVTDAWRPQVNGVVMTLERLAQSLEHMGVETVFLTPEGFRTVALPGYAEIRMALTTPAQVAQRMDAANADRIHIATEGPLGLLARRICIARGLPFTTSYHTRFPEFLRARLPVPEEWTYRWLRRFHNAGNAMMVATPSLAAELGERGFTNIRLWSRGVDTAQFNPAR
jgi:glycosyltransferase involved in cell wall biosynthesis